MLVDLPDERTGARSAQAALDDLAGQLELRLIFPSDPLAVRMALASVMSGLDYLRLTADDMSTLELALAEAMNNVVEHAYAAEPGLLELRINNGPQGLHCEVLDDGTEMPHGTPPPGVLSDPPEEVADLPEGGFGWFLIRELTRDLTYARRGTRNALSFRIALDRTVPRN